ncbi:hypothetical protein GCM10022286_17000 [Gryllotalpicola daejeonensis]|uniref:HTH luxR-type domain-containing protein n=1 Tax=Gryllotalpicola daejeonensis TaxID=993087 RepID=A0ABP7ZJU8_9MICO
MTAIDELRAALREDRWEDIDRLFNRSFFALLLTDPELVYEALDTAPDEWYRDHPRHLMTRGIGAARGPLPLVGSEAEEAFSAWVAAQPQPAARDQLGVLSARLRALMSSQRFFEAEQIADRMIAVIRGAREHAGFPDVLPTALLRIGTAKLLVGDAAAATQLFAEAHRWANIGPVHPIESLVKDHLALAAALGEDFTAARRWLEDRGRRTTLAHGLRYHYETVGLVTRALIAVGGADPQAAQAAIQDADDEGTYFSEMWWVAVHARARFELFWGDPHEGVSHIRRHLQLRGGTAAPALASKLLRADMADLFMMLGDLSAAERELNAPDGARPHPAVRLSKVRLELLRRRGDIAARLLHEAESESGVTPSLSVLRAQVERVACGAVSHRAARRAAFLLRDTGARIALLEADREVRSQLEALSDDDAVSGANSYLYRPRANLTRREAQILRALRQFGTTKEVAAALHLSPNTVKTHLNSLYRKLDVHTRDEALQHYPE